MPTPSRHGAAEHVMSNASSNATGRTRRSLTGRGRVRDVSPRRLARATSAPGVSGDLLSERISISISSIVLLLLLHYYNFFYYYATTTITTIQLLRADEERGFSPAVGR